MKQLEVQIMGQSYLLGCPEGGQSRLLEAVERVDTAMCKIRDAGKVRARDRIAVLAALNLAFDISDQQATRVDGVAGLTTASAPSTARVSTPAAPAARSDEVVGDSEVLLSSLLERLDAALGEDGRLL